MQIRRAVRSVAFVVAAAGLVAASGLLMAQPAGDPAQPSPRQGGARADAPVSVERSMKTMGRALNRLAKQVADPAKKVENVGLVTEAQRACLAAKAGIPRGPWQEETDPAKKLASLIPYRKDMILLEQTLLAAELAILDDQFDLAKAEIDKCLKIRDEGHKRMGVDEE
jgi:hypothetical protein